MSDFTKDEEICVIKEVGDMGLFADPLSEEDRALYEKGQENKEQKSE